MGHLREHGEAFVASPVSNGGYDCADAFGAGRSVTVPLEVECCVPHGEGHQAFVTHSDFFGCQVGTGQGCKDRLAQTAQAGGGERLNQVGFQDERVTG